MLFLLCGRWQLGWKEGWTNEKKRDTPADLRVDVSPSTAQRIRELNQYDVRLYETATRVFEQRLAHLRSMVVGHPRKSAGGGEPAYNAPPQRAVHLHENASRLLEQRLANVRST